MTSLVMEKFSDNKTNRTRAIDLRIDSWSQVAGMAKHGTFTFDHINYFAIDSVGENQTNVIVETVGDWRAIRDWLHQHAHPAYSVFVRYDLTVWNYTHKKVPRGLRVAFVDPRLACLFKVRFA